MSVTETVVIDATEEATIKTFLMDYLLDNGVGVHMVREIARELFGSHVQAGGAVTEEIAQSHRELYSTAVQDVVSLGLFGPSSFDIDKVIAGAASLLFLVQYAHKVDSRVIPRVHIPSDLTVAKALHLFNENKGLGVSSS
jgi:hypothetical protein